MQHFERLIEGIDCAAALEEIDAQPHIWNLHVNRTHHPDSPHRETDDCWLRYRDRKELAGPETFAGPHVSVYYPAWNILPALHPIVARLCGRVGAAELGGILMTRIPPQGQVYPHHDRGTWHADHYDTKLWMPLRANGLCLNHCWTHDEGKDIETVRMKAGDAWSFDNQKWHSVQNFGSTERIVLIVCTRR